jgi:SAM-dependent methyltransferase
MGIIGGKLGYRLLKRLNPTGEAEFCSGSIYKDRSKLELLFGESIWSEISEKSVIDFGCGTGGEAIEMARRGAKKVIGLDVVEWRLDEARRAAEQAGVADRCSFAAATDEKVDVIITLDTFEHFDDPAGVLREMRRLVKDDGCVLAVFGPTWYHPRGGHLFSVFPWAHLIFTEKSLIRWRSDFKSDGATRFGEVEGGLNQMTIRRFERLVAESDFQFESFEAVPIRQLRPLNNRLTREFTTGTVRCKLVPRS